MQPVLLVNPTGGHKHAYHPDEMKADLERGWEVVDLAEQIETKVYSDGASATGPGPLPEESPAKRKPGRPPKAK